MKFILLLSLVLLFSSCEENIESYDTLNAQEQAYIRSQARIKCEAETSADILDIIETSNSHLIQLLRLNTWDLVYKKDDNVIATSKIYVWKVSGSTVYFLVSFTEGGSTSNKFVKFTSAINTEMFQDLRTKKCAKTLTLSVSPSLLTGTTEEGPITIDSASYYKLKTTNSFENPFPAFFGFIYKKRVKKIYNDETNAVTSTETHDYVVDRVADVTTLDTNFESDTLYPNRKYCVVNYTAGATNVYPFPIASDFGLSCTTETSPGPDPDGDLTENFDKSELVI